MVSCTKILCALYVDIIGAFYVDVMRADDEAPDLPSDPCGTSCDIEQNLNDSTKCSSLEEDLSDSGTYKYVFYKDFHSIQPCIYTNHM